MAQAADYASEFPGPIVARVDRVIDGDTVEVSAFIWLGQQVTVRIRILGIDAPELRARCETEFRRAEAARDYLSHRIAGTEVRLTALRHDKYGDRIDANIADARGDIADAMIRARLARAYDGGRRESWCG